MRSLFFLLILSLNTLQASSAFPDGDSTPLLAPDESLFVWPNKSSGSKLVTAPNPTFNSHGALILQGSIASIPPETLIAFQNGFEKNNQCSIEMVLTPHASTDGPIFAFYNPNRRTWLTLSQKDSKWSMKTTNTTLNLGYVKHNKPQHLLFSITGGFIYIWFNGRPVGLTSAPTGVKIAAVSLGGKVEEKHWKGAFEEFGISLKASGTPGARARFDILDALWVRRKQ